MTLQPDHDLFKNLSQKFSLVRLHGKDPSSAEGKGWQRYCSQKRAYAEIPFKPGENAGIACGPASGIIAVDVDNPDLFESVCRRYGWSVPETRTHGSMKGAHLLFKYPNGGKHYGCKAKAVLGLDIKGNGGQVVAPGSIHPDSGQPYTVILDAEPAELPDWVHEIYKDRPAWAMVDIGKLRISDATRQYIKEGVPKGQRSEAIMSVITALAGAGLSDDQIYWALYSFPIGEKFREIRGNRDSWLQKQINKARAYIKANPSNARINDLNSLNSQENDSQQEEWDFDIKEWPILPPKALSGIAGEFVELATRNSEADPAAVLATFLCRAGIEFGTNPYLLVGDSKHHARLNAVVVGNSSKARKGTSAKPVTKLFRFDAQDRTVESSALYVPAREAPGPLSSGEGLIWAVRDAIKVLHVDKKTGDESLVTVDPGVDDKRLFVLDEELAGALKATKREGNTLSVVIRCAFDGGKLAPLTKNNRITATGAHVGIVTHVTMRELHYLLDEMEAFNGFANRFLWVCARRQGLVPLPEPMPKAEVVRMQGRILRIVNKVKGLERIEMSHEARELWCDVYGDISQDHAGLVGCVVNRSEALVMRLALIYALLDASETIQSDHMDAALAMWSYCKESAEYIFHGREANPIAQKILDEAGKGPVSITDIHRSLSNHATKAQIESAIQELLSAGKIEVLEERTDGRTKKIICLAKKAKEAKKGNGAATGDEPNHQDGTDPVRCADCNHLNGYWCGRREGSWNGARGQDPNEPHPCSGFQRGGAA